MECFGVERASTSPSMMVVSMQTVAPPRIARRVRLACDPWT